MNDASSSSTLRKRHNAGKPCAINHTNADADDDRPNTNSSTDISHSGSGDNHNHNHNNNICNNDDRNRGRVRLVKSSKPQKRRRRADECDNSRRRKKEDGEEVRSLRNMMILTAILAVLILVGLFYLTRLLLVIDPDLQYHLPYLKPDASEIDKKGNDFTVLSEDEHINDDSMTTSKTHRGETTVTMSQPLPSPSPVYTIPNSMPHIGDKSEEYARLRKDWDERHPPNSPERSLPALKEVLANGNNGLSSIYNRLQAPPLAATTLEDDDNNDGDGDGDDKHWDYHIFDCPDDPPPGYPREYKTIDILKHWPPTQSLPVGSHYHPNNNTTTNNKNNIKEADNNIIDGDTEPVMAHLGLCVFDYSRDYEKAMRYRSKEVPFVVRNDPSVAETVERWNDENYRRELFGSLDHSDSNRDADIGQDAANESTSRKAYHRAERSITNQVLFRHSRKKKPPQFNKYYPSSSNKGEKTSEKIHGQEDDLPEEGRSQSPPMPPQTKLVAMTYDQWYERAMEKEGNSMIDTDKTGIRYYDPNRNGKKSLYYYYFRLVGCGEKEGCEKNSTEYLFDELPFFQPRGHYPQTSESRPNRGERGRGNSNHQHRHGSAHITPSSMSIDDVIRTTPKEIPESSSSESLYLVQPEKQRGIHCRFGMPGMIAANHYDASRNSIAVLGGSRRYIISRPEQCPNLGLYPIGHESARHSRVDWTTASEDYQNFTKNHDNENGEESETQSSFSSSLDNTPSWIDYRKSLSLLANNATSTEVVLQAGDVLYLPSYWFHYIISLTTNMQCNTRSGRDDRDDQIMADCGFPSPKLKP
jgi:hypothetical protein